MSGLSASGQIVMTKEVEGWYVLAGGSRAYELKLPAPECRSIATLTVDVLIGTSTLKERLAAPAACSP